MVLETAELPLDELEEFEDLTELDEPSAAAAPTVETTAPEPKAERLYTTAEAAELTGRGVSSIQKAISNGSIPGQLGKGAKGQPRYMIPESSLALIEQTIRVNKAAKQARPWRQLNVSSDSKYLSVNELAALTNRSSSVISRGLTLGTIPGTKAQVGPKQWRWMIPREAGLEALEKIEKRPYMKGKRAPYKPRQTNKVVIETDTSLEPAGFFPPQVRSATTDVLTGTLLRLAEVVRANPMLVVESCDVVLRLKG